MTVHVKAPLCSLLLLSLMAGYSVADVYEYTDSSGVTHFTDDPAKVPKEKRRSKRSDTPSLSKEESKALDLMMKLDNKKGQDIPTKQEDLPAVKKGIKEFATSYSEEFGDPSEPLDPRLSTPEGALELFKAGLRTGNLAQIKMSVIPKLWEKTGQFREFNRGQMRELEKAMSGFVITRKTVTDLTAVFSVEDTKTGMTDSIEFTNCYGNWKIRRF